MTPRDGSDDPVDVDISRKACNVTLSDADGRLGIEDLHQPDQVLGHLP